MGSFRHNWQLEPLRVAADDYLQSLPCFISDAVAVAVGVAGLGQQLPGALRVVTRPGYSGAGSHRLRKQKVGE